MNPLPGTPVQQMGWLRTAAAQARREAQQERTARLRAATREQELRALSVHLDARADALAAQL